MKTVRDYTLKLAFLNGRAFTLDLREFVHRLKGLRPLRDPGVFALADVGEGGFSLVWPGEFDVGADRLYEIALECLRELRLRGGTHTACVFTAPNGRDDPAEHIDAY